MSISEKAKSYVEGNVLEALTSAIEKAYNDGYRAGRNDAIRSNTSEVESIGGVKYIDLGLPSGTKWATDFLKDDKGNYKVFELNDAEILNIPTIEQYNELINCCKYECTYGITHVIECCYVGPNGNKIRLQSFRIDGKDYDASSFWLRDESSAIKTFAFHNAFGTTKKRQTLPVLLVKN